jgi:hypothetical protein
LALNSPRPPWLAVQLKFTEVGVSVKQLTDKAVGWYYG